MPETIESFVKKLQDDGVAAGKAKAEELLSEAKTEADGILEKAKQEAERIVADAKQEAERIAEAQRNELRLAARDSLLELRKALGATLEAVLKQKAASDMQDGDFIKQLIRDVVSHYAKADQSSQAQIAVSVNEELFSRVSDWAVGELASDKVDLQGKLKAAGFEYSVADATVEVTLDSVVEILKGQVSPRLQTILQAAASN